MKRVTCRWNREGEGTTTTLHATIISTSHQKTSLAGSVIIIYFFRHRRHSGLSEAGLF